jgi:predicted anti-sigma-YlaC factor YlaD
MDDDALSAFVDEQLGPDEYARVSAHLQTCSECQDRLDGFRSVAALLRRLPDLDPPRDFSLGPRLVVESPNVVHLRRWYAASRVAAAALAAVFVVLAGFTLFVDSRPEAAVRTAASAPALAARTEPTETAVPAAARPVAPAAQPPVQAPAAGVGAAASPHPTPSGAEADDQVAAAATAAIPLPTPIPTPVPTAVAVAVAALVSSSPPDAGAPLRAGAILVGLLAVVALLLAVVIRHRLQRASHP